MAGSVALEDFLDRWYAARLRSDEIDEMVGKALIEDEHGFDEPARVRSGAYFQPSRSLPRSVLYAGLIDRFRANQRQSPSAPHGELRASRPGPILCPESR